MQNFQEMHSLLNYLCWQLLWRLWQTNNASVSSSLSRSTQLLLAISFIMVLQEVPAITFQMLCFNTHKNFHCLYWWITQTEWATDTTDSVKSSISTIMFQPTNNTTEGTVTVIFTRALSPTSFTVITESLFYSWDVCYLGTVNFGQNWQSLQHGFSVRAELPVDILEPEDVR